MARNPFSAEFTPAEYRAANRRVAGGKMFNTVMRILGGGLWEQTRRDAVTLEAMKALDQQNRREALGTGPGTLAHAVEQRPTAPGVLTPESLADHAAAVADYEARHPEAVSADKK